MLEVFYDIEDCKIPVDLLNKVYFGVLKHLELNDEFEVELTVTDEATIREVNLASRNIDKVTDVLSFPSVEIKRPFDIKDYSQDIDYSTGRLMLGEILLCEEKALQQAEEYGHSFERECGFLTLHGLLHLFGYDHIEETDRIKMRQAEESIMADINLPRNI